jgi:hypothetical protein
LSKAVFRASSVISKATTRRIKMKYVQRLLTGIGGLAAAAALLTIMSPRAHALVAAMVQVANTTANPVPVFNTGHAAYQSSRTILFCGNQVCGAAFDAAPAGYRLVIENVSGSVFVTSTATRPPVITLGVDNNAIFGASGVLGPAFQAVINQSIKAYVASGVQPILDLTADLPLNSGANITLSGYLENCAITGCP